MSKIPSIALAQEGYKAGKVYCVLPTNGDADLDFSRSTTKNRTNKQGLIEEIGINVPDLDYSDGGCPSLLLEPQSTNLITETKDFSQVWTAVETTINSNSKVNIFGDANTFSVIPSTNDVSNHRLQFSGFSLVNGQTYTLSYYVEKKGYESVTINVGASRVMAQFGLTSETVINSSSSGTDATNQIARIKKFNDDVYIVSLTFDVVDNTGLNYTRLVVNETETLAGSSGQTYSGDGVSGIYVHHAQIENLPYASSPIETNGSIETRTVDFYTSNNLGNYINDSKGVYYIEVKFEHSTKRVASSGGLVLGTTNTFPSPQAIEISMSAGGDFRVGERDGSFSVLSSLPSGVNYKVAVKWDNLNLSVYINGVEESTSIISSTDFKYIYYNGSDSSKHIKDLRIYKTALTDQELIDLTSTFYSSFNQMANKLNYNII